ncbi:MAG: carbon starvation protein A [Planctomycetota bacterium]|nr:carbon starvation protein A [Planctomycetota bacterium]
MSAALAVVCAFIIYGLAFRFYARHLGRRVYALDDQRRTPAHALEDGVDFVPTNRFVLFGHHWASITGLAPMLGPAVAVIWGWGPAMLWVVLGAVLVGCVHDFSALVVSMRARGVSIGKVAEGVIGPRAKLLFLLIIFFGIALAMGVFTIYISKLFSGKYGTAVIPSGGIMLIAAVIGWMVYKRGFRLGPLTAVGFVVMLLLVWLGKENPVTGIDGDSWSTILLIYAFAASVLPVWSLLQPRDFLNSLLLYLGLFLGYVGFFVAAPEFAAPALNIAPEGAPPIFPFVFITIACGAASGFHGLVSSGTTAKQINKETDAPFIGYGGMVGESMLGLLAVLATSAGIALGEQSPASVWESHYHSWEAVKATPLDNFISGTARFLGSLGIGEAIAQSFIAVLVVSFALTTLDSATRLLRYNISELGESIRVPQLGNRYIATTLAVLAIGFFAFFKVDGKPAGLALWSLFGTTNQILAGLTLLTVTLYLMQRRRNPWFTGIPMIFMLSTSIIAMVFNLGSFSNDWSFDEGTLWPLLTVGASLLLLATWLVVEAVLATRRTLIDEEPIERMDVFSGPSEDA